MRRSSWLLLLPVALSAAVAQRPGGGGPPRVFLVALDTDGDGQLSPAEIAAAPASLKKLDRNGDGQITPDEYNPKQEDKTAVSEMTTRLMAMDKNGDGVLTLDEVPERMQPMFQRGDTNHDGKLTVAEIEAMSKTQADPQGRPVERGKANSNDPIVVALDVDRDGVISAAEIASAPGALKTLDKDADGTLSVAELRIPPQTARQRAEHLFEEWDTNQDGALLKTEMPDQMQPQFEAIDLNHDGKVDLEEATKYFASMPQGGGPGGPGGGGPGGPGGPGRGPREGGRPPGDAPPQ